MESFNTSQEELRDMTIKTGTASLLIEKSGALRIYVKKDVSGIVDLPPGETLKATYDTESKKLTIEPL
jgi:hypothetical protein